MTPEFKVGDIVERTVDSRWSTGDYPVMQVGDRDTVISVSPGVYRRTTPDIRKCQILYLKKFGPGHSSTNFVLAKSLEKKKLGFAKFVSRLDEMTPEYVNRFKS